MKLDKDLAEKLRRFKLDKRAYVSFLFLLVAFAVALPAEFLCNIKPILLVVDGRPYFPIFVQYGEKDFGGALPSEPDYKSEEFIRLLKGLDEYPENAKTAHGVLEEKSKVLALHSEDFAENGDRPFALDLRDFDEKDFRPEGDASFSIGMEDFEDESPPANKPAGEETSPAPETPGPAAPKKPRAYWALWPPVRYDYKYIPTKSRTGEVVLAAPYMTYSSSRGSDIESSWLDGHYLGTDDRGRDVLARLLYGFRISMLFGISLAITGTIVGCLLGGIQGYFGGWIDLIGQRLTEIWGSMPRLYILIILSSFLVPSALILFVILNLTAWMGIAAYIRAEFLKGRNLEYVKAAKAMGVSNFEIMRRHILPNSLTPVITFFPFEVTSGILALVSLDYLNLGVPSPAPSIGELLSQGKTNLHAVWILLPTFTALTLTLTLLTFVGEGIRNAFDPRAAG